jgi:hypothetical protein
MMSEIVQLLVIGLALHTGQDKPQDAIKQMHAEAKITFRERAKMLEEKRRAMEEQKMKKNKQSEDD